MTLKTFVIFSIILNSSLLDGFCGKNIGSSLEEIEKQRQAILKTLQFKLMKPYSFGELFKEYWIKRDMAAKYPIYSSPIYPSDWVDPLHEGLRETFGKLYFELAAEKEVDPIKLLGFDSFGKQFGRWIAVPSAEEIIFGWPARKNEDVDKKAQEARLKWERHLNSKERQAVMDVIDAAAQYLKK